MLAKHFLRFKHYERFHTVPEMICGPNTTDYSHAYPCYAAYRFATRRPKIKLPPEIVSLQNSHKYSSPYNGDILRAC